MKKSLNKMHEEYQEQVRDLNRLFKSMMIRKRRVEQVRRMAEKSNSEISEAYVELLDELKPGYLSAIAAYEKCRNRVEETPKVWIV